MLDPFEGTCSLAFLADLLQVNPKRIQQLARLGVITRERRGWYAHVASVQGYVRYLHRQLPRKRRRGGPRFVRENNSVVFYFTREEAKAVGRALCQG